MDPLSITAAAVSFVALAGTCGRRLNNILSTAKHAPTEILALANEVSDLNLIINDIDSLRINSMCGDDCDLSSIDLQLALSTQLSKAKDNLLCLQELIDQVFVNANGQAIFSRQKWVRKKSLAISLKREMVEVKRNLTLLLASVTA